MNDKRVHLGAKRQPATHFLKLFPQDFRENLIHGAGREQSRSSGAEDKPENVFSDPKWTQVAAVSPFWKDRQKNGFFSPRQTGEMLSVMGFHPQSSPGDTELLSEGDDQLMSSHTSPPIPSDIMALCLTINSALLPPPCSGTDVNESSIRKQ